MKIKCVANNGNNGEEEVPLWLCPCLECTRMEWEIQHDDEDRGTLREFRVNNWPEHYNTHERKQ